MRRIAEGNLTRTRALAITVLSSFVAGALVACGLIYLAHAQQTTTKAGALRVSDLATARSDYEFIDPLIGIKGVNNSAQYAGLESKVAAFVASEKKSGLVVASVNFRDINESGGFSLNPAELYTPASLNKVPVMMTYYKIAETHPSILQDEIVYSGRNDTSAVQEIKSAVQIVPGASYTVDELIEHMIRYSDNNAVDLLVKHIQDTGNSTPYVSVYADLGIDPIVLTEYTDNITAPGYSIFLRSLYNATYLSRESSERALKLLSETDFSEGIESGVPNGVAVAQKFGEVRMTDAAGNFLGKQLNNCGIVYKGMQSLYP